MPADDQSQRGSPRPARRPARTSRPIGVVVTAAAGFVDAVGYLVLAHVFVANMSGNSAAVGLYAARGQWGQVLRRGYPIVAFTVGLIVGGIVAETERRTRSRAATAVRVLGLEAALLAALLVGSLLQIGAGAAALRANQPWWTHLALVTLAAGAMGVQNVGLRAAGVLSVYTTHVTGTLTQLADLLARSIIRRRRRAFSDADVKTTAPSLSRARHLAGLWVAYVIGAFVGVLTLDRWGVACIAIPLALLVATISWIWVKHAKSVD